MKITEHTSTILKLQANNKSSRLSGLFSGSIGTFLLLVGGAILLFTSKLEVPSLNCDRLEQTQVSCQLTLSSLLQKNTISIPPGYLQGAEVETDNGGDFRIVLIAKNKKIPLNNFYYSNGRAGADIKVKQINDFVSDSDQPLLTFKQGFPWSFYVYGSLFILAGVWFIFSVLNTKWPTSYLFDKPLGRVYLTTRSFLRSETLEKTFEEIKEARVIEEVASDKHKIYHLALVLRSGEQILLEPKFIYSLQPSACDSEIAQTINQFLEIEPESSNSHSARQNVVRTALPTIVSILTPDQLEQMQQMRQNRRPNRSQS